MSDPEFKNGNYRKAIKNGFIGFDDDMRKGENKIKRKTKELEKKKKKKKNKKQETTKERKIKNFLKLLQSFFAKFIKTLFF